MGGDLAWISRPIVGGSLCHGGSGFAMIRDVSTMCSECFRGVPWKSDRLCPLYSEKRSLWRGGSCHLERLFPPTLEYGGGIGAPSRPQFPINWGSLKQSSRDNTTWPHRYLLHGLVYELLHDVGHIERLATLNRRIISKCLQVGSH